MRSVVLLGPVAQEDVGTRPLVSFGTRFVGGGGEDDEAPVGADRRLRSCLSFACSAGVGEADALRDAGLPVVHEDVDLLPLVSPLDETGGA